MMKETKNILLVHPLGYSKNKAAQDIARVVNLMPPLGLVSISAYLDKNGIKNRIIDCFAHPNSDNLIRSYIIEKNSGL